MADLVRAHAIALKLATDVRELADALTDAIITTADAFDRALATSPAGAVLTLSPMFVYNSPLKIQQPITIQSEALIHGRMPKDMVAPKFLNGIQVLGDYVNLVGLEIRHARSDVDLVVVNGAHCVLDRLLIMGDPVKGAKRGIAGNGADLTIVSCYVDDCIGAYPNPFNHDPQALGIWDAPGPFLIEDNFLSGGAQSILIGGGDPSSSANIPSDGVIRKNTILGNPAWQREFLIDGKPVGMKTRLEFKNAKRWVVEQNVIEGAWGGHGQDGYLLTLTVRNQSGHAPYATIEDVTIQKNEFSHGAAAINILGSDNNHPSQRMARVSIIENTFADLDPLAYTGSNRMILVNRGPQDLRIAVNTFAGQNIGSQVYFAGLPQCERLDVINNVWPKSKYGIFGNNATVAKPGQLPPPAWTQYVASGTLNGNREV